MGVLTQFGRVTGEVLPEGLHVVSPLQYVNKLTIQTQNLKEAAQVPSKEGMLVSMDTSLLYHLDPTKAANVYPPHSITPAHPSH